MLQKKKQDTKRNMKYTKETGAASEVKYGFSYYRTIRFGIGEISQRFSIFHKNFLDVEKGEKTRL